MIDKYIKFLAEELQENKLVIFVGAGVSMNCGLPSWNGLIDEFSTYLGINKGNGNSYTSEETLLIPQIFYDEFGKIKYYEILNKVFKKELSCHKIHDYLKELSPNYIITTNYDTLIEKKLNEGIKKYDVITREKDLAYSQRDKMIIKMHGDLTNRNVVLKKDDYDNYENNFPLITTFVKSLFTTNTILFIGYSLNDVNVKLIMKWIKEILKDDFRKVYLADLSKLNIQNKYSNANDKLTNKIFVRNLDKNQKYLNNLDEDEKEDKGKLLANFLETIRDKTKESNSLLRGKLFKELKYIPDSKVKNILREDNDEINVNFTSYSRYNSSPYLIKNISIRSCSDSKINYNNINYLLKSNIQEINNKKIKDFEEMDIEKEELEQKHNLNNILFQLVVTYNFKDLNNLIAKEKIENKLFIAYCYYIQNKFLESKKIFKNFSNESSEPELILWGIFNLYLVEQKEKRFGVLDSENYNIDLEEKYFDYFDNTHTDLYDEIFNNSLVKSYNDYFSNILFKIKENKNSFQHPYSEVEKAQIKVRDFLNYIFLNGYIADFHHLPYYVSKTKDIFRNYVDIILYAYKNKAQDNSSELGKKNILKQFSYIDLYIMLKIDFKKLEILFEEYNIRKLVLNKDSIEILINAFKNFITYFLNSKLKLYDSNVIDRFLLILTKVDLIKEDIEKTLEVLNNEDIIRYFSSESYSLIIRNLDKNLDKIDCKIIETFIKKFLETRNSHFIYVDNLVIGYLSDVYNTKTNKKLDLRDEIEKAGYYDDIVRYMDKIKEKVEKNLETTEDELQGLVNLSNLERILTNVLYLSRIIEKDMKEEIKKMGKDYLNNNFSIEIYYLMCTLDLIEVNNNYYEKQIINKIDERFTENRDNPQDNKIFIEYIIYLILGEYVSEEFKDSLKWIDNNTFKEFLVNNKYCNIYCYSLTPSDFNFKNFNMEDLKFLTNEKLMDILKKDSTNHLKKILKDYLTKEYENKYLNALLELEV